MRFLLLSLIGFNLFCSGSCLVTLSKDLKRTPKIEKQITEAQKFFMQLPGAESLISHIEICPRSSMGRWSSIILRDKRLLITSGHSADRLREWWDNGLQFKWRSRERRLWPYLNPNGFFQTSMRTVVANNAKSFVHFLESLAQSSDSTKTIVQKIFNHLYEKAVPENELKALLHPLEEKELLDLKKILQLWADHLKNPQNIPLSVTNEELPASKPIYQTTIALFPIANYHRIRVSVNSGDGPKSTLSLVKPYSDLPLRAFTFGIVAIHTVDDIEVRVDYHALGFIFSGLRTVLHPNASEL